MLKHQLKLQWKFNHSSCQLYHFLISELYFWQRTELDGCVLHRHIYYHANQWYETLLSLLPRVSEKEPAPSSKMLQQPDSREQPHQDSAEKKDMSDAVTVPVKRRLVWGEQEGAEERENRQSTEEEEKQDEQAVVAAQRLEKNNKDANEDKKIAG